MSADMSKDDQPSLPQSNDIQRKRDRQFELSVARTKYNYMQSYLEGLPISADVPEGESFSIAYNAKVIEAFIPLAENFKAVVTALLERKLANDLPKDVFAAIEESYAKLEENHNFLKEIDLFKELIKNLSELPNHLKLAVEKISHMPGDLSQMFEGLSKVTKQAEKDGLTAYLNSALFLMLSENGDHSFVAAESVDDYDTQIFKKIPKPQVLTLPRQDWMLGDDKPCEQDWYFGYSQTAGFNTTILTGVVAEDVEGQRTISLARLQQKFPISDAIFQSVIGRKDTTLAQAVQQRRLFVCDYTMMVGATGSVMHEQQRYICAPIALFYWNPSPPAGFPRDENVLQPIAIQLAQQFDAESAPIFTPNNCSNADDENGLKWKMAKYIVNVVSETQHEAVAHLGACHLTVDPMVIATHRQLSEKHPIFTLLKPHFRFTIKINNSAAHGLIIPGGTVATNLGPTIESMLTLIADARAAWRWDEECPDQLFKLRGVDADGLTEFPFRDDTLLLWDAIEKFVGAYIKAYYPNDMAVSDDYEVQAWVNELVNPKYADLKGMNGLKETGDAKLPYCIDSRDYLIKVVAQIIYIAGPKHASVNYAQFPLMAYTPSGMASMYKAPPDKNTVLEKPEDCMPWYPPLDIVLNTVSFGYLLSAVQFDTFGYYNESLRIPYFKDPDIAELNLDFQGDLARIEAIIRQRNKKRAMPYLFQLPSSIPNSISI